MKQVIFIIQGEGRGHMTQAIALAQRLENSNYTVAACLIGVVKSKTIPPILQGAMSCPIIPFESPNLIYGKRSGELKVRKTIFKNLLRSGRYINNLNRINKVIESYDADVVVNFYDVLGGMYNLCINQNRRPFIPIAHQYYMMHADFPHPQGYRMDQLLLTINSRITSALAPRRFALSFRNTEVTYDPRIMLVPPLLRNEVLQLRGESELGGYILCYCTQQSMIDRIEKIKKTYPDQEVHCFSPIWKGKNATTSKSGIIFHKIDSQKFLEMMSQCRILITTAGFESVCESFYLGKKSLLIPLLNHYEQKCNAIDAQIAGAGMLISNFKSLSRPAPLTKGEHQAYLQWVNSANSIFLNILNDSQVGLRSKSLIQDSLFTALKYLLAPLRKSLSIIYSS